MYWGFQVPLLEWNWLLCRALLPSIHLEADGVQVTATASYPLFAQESLDKLLNEILIPMYVYKKHSGLLGGGSPLGVPFVKNLLAELENTYVQEQARESMSAVSSSGGSGVPDSESTSLEPVTEEEAAALKKEFSVKQQQLLMEMGTAYLSTNVLLLSWSDPSLEATLCSHPLMKDGAAKLFSWMAGLDATKDPVGKVSIYRMKASADEARMASSVDFTSKLLREADSAVFLSGRNQLLHKDMKKAIQSLKPKVGMKEMTLVPDEAELLKALHGEGRNAYGSIDTAEQYIHVVKTSKLWKERRPTQRRFVPGNTAFKNMTGLPILDKNAMVKVPAKERENIFRGVVGTDRWNPGTSKKAPASAAAATAPPTSAAPGPEDDEEEEEEDAAAPSTEGIMDSEGNVTLFFMEQHPKAGWLKGLV